MARERFVTRTVTITNVEVMTVNTKTAQVTNITAEIGGGITGADALLKAVKATHETDEVKCVAIVSSSTKDVLYGMPESTFIKLAKVLPPRSKIEQ